MGIFGGAAHRSSKASEAETLIRGDAATRAEAKLVAGASDEVLRNRFALVWAKDFAIPSEMARRVAVVEGAIVEQERAEALDLHARAESIGGLDDEGAKRLFGAPLPREGERRILVSVNLAAQDPEGFEAPRVAARRALDQARKVRGLLNIAREDADHFKDISPLARVLWKHVPEMAGRLGLRKIAGEGYSRNDAETLPGNEGLGLHNAGADARSAVKMRQIFSSNANAELDVLFGVDGSGGRLSRLVAVTADRLSMRRVQEEAPARIRDFSAAAFLSRSFSR